MASILIALTLILLAAAFTAVIIKAQTVRASEGRQSWIGVLGYVLPLGLVIFAVYLIIVGG